MIAIARAPDTRDIFDGVAWFTVPDIKVPPGIGWSADPIPGQLATQIHFETEAQSVSTLWHGPHTIGGNTCYIIDAPRRVLKALRNQLGHANVTPLIKALRASSGIRAWAKAQGFNLIRNNRVPRGVVSILPPLVICGNSPVDLDGDELDEAEELPNMED